MGESLILLNLTPDEAQKYIDGSSSVLNYAPKLGVEALPADKKSYYRGKVIDQPDAYIQENYNANQFHGQVSKFEFAQKNFAKLTQFAPPRHKYRRTVWVKQSLATVIGIRHVLRTLMLMAKRKVPTNMSIRTVKTMKFNTGPTRAVSIVPTIDP